MTDNHVVIREHNSRPARWRTKLFGPKILRVRRRMLVRRNVSDVLATLGSFQELSSTFRYLYFRDEKALPRENVSLFAEERTGRKGLDLIGVHTDDGVVFRTGPEAMTDFDGEVTCRAIDVSTTEIRLALGFIRPLNGLRALGATLIKPALDGVVRDELRRLKQYLETGEVAKAA